MNATCVLQARMGSERLYGKALIEVCGRPMLAWIIERLSNAETIDKIVVATTIRAEDDVIADLAEACGVSSFRGPVDNVLGRIVRVVEESEAEVIAHASGDNPLVDWEILDTLVTRCWEGDYDFAFMVGLPLGVGVDVFARRTLLALDRLATTEGEREHVNAYIFDHIGSFKIGRLLPSAELRRAQLRLTVDTPEDLRLIREIYKRLYRTGETVRLKDVLKLHDEDPDLFLMNSHIEQQYVSYAARLLRSL